MQLEVFCEEVAFEALIQKCKSVSQGRRLKGEFVSVQFESSEEQFFFFFLVLQKVNIL